MLPATVITLSVIGYFVFGALFSRGLYLYRLAKGKDDWAHMHFPAALFWPFVIFGWVVGVLHDALNRVYESKAVVDFAYASLRSIDAFFIWALRLKPNKVAE